MPAGSIATTDIRYEPGASLTPAILPLKAIETDPGPRAVRTSGGGVTGKWRRPAWPLNESTSVERSLTLSVNMVPAGVRLCLRAICAALLAATRDPALGDLRAVEIEVRFKEWPRPWQSQAGAWLAERREGGFTREVLSHFVFAMQRALGEAVVRKSSVAWPFDGNGAERGLMAQLDVGGVPVSVKGEVDGNVADFNRVALRGRHASIEFRDWLTTRDGKPWENHGVDVIRVRHGRIVSLHENNDVRLVREHFPPYLDEGTG